MLARAMRAVAALDRVVLLSGCDIPVDLSPDDKKVLGSESPGELAQMNADGSTR